MFTGRDDSTRNEARNNYVPVLSPLLLSRRQNRFVDIGTVKAGDSIFGKVLGEIRK
jgi:hypothetical protein